MTPVAPGHHLRIQIFGVTPHDGTFEVVATAHASTPDPVADNRVSEDLAVTP